MTSRLGHVIPGICLLSALAACDNSGIPDGAEPLTAEQNTLVTRYIAAIRGGVSVMIDAIESADPIDADGEPVSIPLLDDQNRDSMTSFLEQVGDQLTEMHEDERIVTIRRSDLIDKYTDEQGARAETLGGFAHGSSTDTPDDDYIVVVTEHCDADDPPGSCRPWMGNEYQFGPKTLVHEGGHFVLDPGLGHDPRLEEYFFGEIPETEIDEASDPDTDLRRVLGIYDGQDGITAYDPVYAVSRFADVMWRYMPTQLPYEALLEGSFSVCGVNDSLSRNSDISAYEWERYVVNAFIVIDYLRDEDGALVPDDDGHGYESTSTGLGVVLGFEPPAIEAIAEAHLDSRALRMRSATAEMARFLDAYPELQGVESWNECRDIMD